MAIPFFRADRVGVRGAFFAVFGGGVVGVVDDGGRHVGQNHSPGEGGAVMWAQSQWYHDIGQSGLSQQIQFSELSGIPQVQVYWSAPFEFGGLEGGVSVLLACG